MRPPRLNPPDTKAPGSAAVEGPGVGYASLEVAAVLADRGGEQVHHQLPGHRVSDPVGSSANSSSGPATRPRARARGDAGCPAFPGCPCRDRHCAGAYLPPACWASLRVRCCFALTTSASTAWIRDTPATASVRAAMDTGPSSSQIQTSPAASRRVTKTACRNRCPDRSRRIQRRSQPAPSGSFASMSSTARPRPSRQPRQRPSRLLGKITACGCSSARPGLLLASAPR
jgi:hypothetical protein